MPHFPKPFFREDRGLWYVQLYGKQHNLGRDKDAAFRKYHDLMRAPAPVASELVMGVIEGFLDWCCKHRAPRTYEGHRWHLQRFVDQLPNAGRMTVEELKPHHVVAWVDAHPDWGQTYRRNAKLRSAGFPLGGENGAHRQKPRPPCRKANGSPP